jgi:hypothetical protein
MLKKVGCGCYDVLSYLKRSQMEPDRESKQALSGWCSSSKLVLASPDIALNNPTSASHYVFL